MQREEVNLPDFFLCVNIKTRVAEKLRDDIRDTGITCDGGAGSRLTETRGLKLVPATTG